MPVVVPTPTYQPSGLLAALSLQNADSTDIALISGSNRSVTSAAGLTGFTSREVVIDRSGRSGSRNLTRYRTDTPIVITGLLIGDDPDDLWTQYDAVAGALADAIDTNRLLKWQAGSSLFLQRQVRLTSLDAPLTPGPNMITYQATLRASDPNVYSQTLQTATATPLGSTSGGGFVIPFTFPYAYNAPASTVAAFTNGGFVPTPPLFQLTGYLQNPTIQLDSSNKMVLNGEIGDGDLLVIDVDARTMTLNGRLNARSLLNTSQSSWFNLPRGSGTITLVASNWTPGAGLSVSWRDARN